MAEAPRSSFIPKQTKTAVSSRVQKKRHFNILGIISTVLLLSSLVFAGGTYFYHGYVEKGLVEAKQTLAEERGRFNEADMASVRELDRKFAAADYLLSNHLAPSKIFDALELSTKESVQFTNLSFSRGSEQDVSLTVRGATEAFKSVALQKLAFGENRILDDMVFTELANNQAASPDTRTENQETVDTSAVSFNVSGAVRSERLSYDGRIAESEGTAHEAPTQTGTSTDPGTGTSTGAGTEDVEQSGEGTVSDTE